MQESNENKPKVPNRYLSGNTWIVVAILLFLGIAIFTGWRIGIDNRPGPPPPPTGTGSIKSLVSYSLPKGWTDKTCQGHLDVVYVATSATASIDCKTSPNSPVTMSVDPQATTDCNQLQNNPDVKKHTCISLYIDNHKSLYSVTDYSIPIGSGTEPSNVSDYYIDTGKGVVKLELVGLGSDTSNDVSFKQLAMSIKVN